MTDKQLIAEFSRLVHVALNVHGVIAFTTRDLQETDVLFEPFRLSRGYFVNGEVRVTVFSYPHSSRVFFESEGGPGIYGVGDTDNHYNLDALRALLPELRALTVLDQLADV